MRRAGLSMTLRSLARIAFRSLAFRSLEGLQGRAENEDAFDRGRRVRGKRCVEATFASIPTRCLTQPQPGYATGDESHSREWPRNDKRRPSDRFGRMTDEF